MIESGGSKMSLMNEVVSAVKADARLCYDWPIYLLATSLLTRYFEGGYALFVM